MCSGMYGAMDSYIKQIRELVPEAVLYEQLAEECNELAQACLKKARKLRGENYTPKTIEEKEMFYKVVNKLSREVYIRGNKESWNSIFAAN